MIKFTISIPTYKAKFFKECINSVLAQSYTNFEIIILNDKSPENILEIVEDFKDDRIKYYENDINCGALNVVDNWNKILELSTGEYIVCMGDDDKLLECCLQEYADLIEKYPDLDAYHGWTEVIDENSNFLRLQELRPEYESVYSMIWHRWNGRIQFIGDFLFRTEMLKKKGGYYKLPLAWASDDITSFILSEEKGIANTQTPVFQYRVNSKTISSIGNAENKIEALELEKEWYSNFLNADRELFGTDVMFQKMLQNEYKVHFLRKKIMRIKMDFISGFTIKKLSYWLKKRSVYQITLPMIFKAYFDSLVFRYSKRVNNSNI